MNKLLITVLSLITICSNAFGMNSNGMQIASSLSVAAASAASADSDAQMTDVKAAAEVSGGEGASRPAKRLKTLSGAAVALATLKKGENDDWLAGEESSSEARKRKIRNAIQQAPLSLRERKKALYAKLKAANISSSDSDGDVKMASEDSDADATETESDNDEAYAKEYEEYVERYGTDELDQLIQKKGTQRNKLGQILLSCTHPGCTYRGPKKQFDRHCASHENERKFNCTKCVAKFNVKKHLDQHLKRHENKNGTFKCTQCDLYYETSKGLKIHIDKTHNAKFIHCPEPGCKFTVQPQALHLHLKIHAKHQPKHTFSHNKGSFECDHCGDKFEDNNKKAVHIARFHNPQMVSCPKCHKRITKTGLTMHLRYHK